MCHQGGKKTVIFHGNTVSGSTVSSLSTGPSSTHILTRMEILCILRWQNAINVYGRSFSLYVALGHSLYLCILQFQKNIAAFPINPLPYRAKTSCRFHLKNVTLAETEWNLHFSNEICNICTNQG